MSNIGHMLCGIFDSMETAMATEHAKLVQIPDDDPKWSTTERVLARMLRENTGASILDSGSFMGRAWQHNLSVDFKRVPDSTVEFTIERDGKAWINITHHLFRWLSEAVEYDRRMTKHLRQFAKTPEFERETWFRVVRHFPEWLAKRWKCEVGGIYGESDPITIYTYNEGSLTSQDFQFTHFTCDGGPHDEEEFAAIFVHNGCDARGGFTDPIVFKAPIDGGGTIGIFDYKRASVAPNWREVQAVIEAFKQNTIDRPALFSALDRERLIEIDDFRHIRWNTEDCGYELSWEGALAGGRDLHNYPTCAIEHRSEWTPGVLCVMPDKSGLCPITGCTLQSWFY